jgi:hypothetical protein
VERWNGGTVERWNGGTVERWNASALWRRAFGPLWIIGEFSRECREKTRIESQEQEILRFAEDDRSTRSTVPAFTVPSFHR